MLISRRKEGETINVGDDVEIRIVAVRRKKVILGIIAPRDVRITATKLTEAEMANTMAAANSVELNDLPHAPRDEQEQVLFLLEVQSAMTDKTPGEPA
jgi:carbon storage regulator